MSFVHLFMLGKVKLDNHIRSSVITTLVEFRKSTITYVNYFGFFNQYLSSSLLYPLVFVRINKRAINLKIKFYEFFTLDNMLGGFSSLTHNIVLFVFESTVTFWGQLTSVIFPWS